MSHAQHDFDTEFRRLAEEWADAYYCGDDCYDADATEWKNIPWIAKKDAVAAYLRTEDGYNATIENVTGDELANAIDNPAQLAALIRDAADVAMNLYWNAHAEDVAADAERVHTESCAVDAAIDDYKERIAAGGGQ